MRGVVFLLASGAALHAVATELDANDHSNRPAQSSPGSLDQPEEGRQAADALESASGDIVDLGKTIVTGSHIRGGQNAGSRLIIIDREDIESSGLGRIQDVLETLPQNFSGSAGEDFIGDIGSANTTRGQAVDLRGLGASSTLILVNGRRQPAGGLEGSFVDIASIATAAVERIEVLAEGASAIYGSDAIGGVVNFILRKDYQGAETSVRMASSHGGAEELRLSQVLGKTWANANVLVGYQYYKREPLPAEAAPYASASGDLRPFGGSDFRTTAPQYYLSNPGNILNPATLRPAFAIPAGQDGRDLDSGDLLGGAINFHDEAEGDSALPEQQTHGTFLSAAWRPIEGLELFTEGRYSERDMRMPTGGLQAFLLVPSSNPFYVNPSAGTSVWVGYDLGPDLGQSVNYASTLTYSATAGVSAELWGDWGTNLALTHGKETNEWEWANNFNFARMNAALADANPASAFNPFGEGSNTNPATIDAVRETVTGEGVAATLAVTLVADGPLARLPGGDAKLAIGVDFRDEMLEAENGAVAPSSGIYTRAARSVGDMERNVWAAFAEISLPILGDREGGSWKGLDLSLAGRHERYSDFGTTTNPKIGLAWAPFDALKLRGTWGTSFRAPRFNQLSPAVNPSRSIRAVVTDPRSPTGTTSAFIINGYNPGLKEETARVWTAGFDFLPTAAPGFAFSVTYFDLDYRNKIGIGGPASHNNTLQQEEQWAEFVTRNPTPEQVNAVCMRPDFAGSCTPAPSVILDRRLQNLAVVRVNGLDFDAEQTFDLASARLELGVQGTRTFGYKRSVSATAPLFDVANTFGNLLGMRMRGRVWLTQGSWTAGAYVNYQGDYDDPANARAVDDWMTLDLNVGYRIDKPGTWLDGTQLKLSAVNVLDEPPPFVNVRAGFDAANASELGRIVSAQVVKQW